MYCPAEFLRAAARFAIQEQSQQALNLGIVRHELQEHAREPDGLLGEVAASLVGAGHVVPTNAEGGVNGLQHGIEALRQIALLRNLKANARPGESWFGSDQALTHGRRRNKKGRGNACRVQAQNGLQHQRRVHGRVDRRVRTDEEQLQAFIGKLGWRDRFGGSSR